MAHDEFDGSFRLRRNAAAQADADYGAEQRTVLNRGRFLAAHATISTWPGYAPTPLTALPGLAEAAAIGQLLYKDEAGRFGLGSFKPLGDGVGGRSAGAPDGRPPPPSCSPAPIGRSRES